ncbi:MAG: ExeM/NucH family extracellular endonuclease, partial [Acidimicrobiales bacterium]
MTTLAIASPTAAGAAGHTVFINELHYDNTSTDVGEFFEVAGPAGTDLTGWTVVLYNGNGGGTYNTIGLSGTIPDESGGFGAISFGLPTNGLQNGSPDGLALVDDGAAVIEFLSYEGSILATNGPANGTTSTDIGVSESSGTSIGDSLQRTGTALEADDFTWTGPSMESPGDLNDGQVFGEPPEPEPLCDTAAEDLTLISEVQGSGFESPLDGVVVTVRAVVTLADSDLDGYFIQEEDADHDADPLTSEG